jgi:hypothetical protein
LIFPAGSISWIPTAFLNFAPVSPFLQTVAALSLVVLAAGLLLRSALRKRKQPGCGDSCGAVSPEVKKLRARLKS